MSQKTVPWQEPVEGQDFGHGCGHNLLGVGSLGAALALSNVLKSGEIKGTIRYLGCPAEERFFGKTKMDELKVFDDLDACFTWHPNNRNFIRLHGGLAIKNLRFKFYGISAHSSSSPHLGRNALSAVELMNIGSQYLRERLSSTGKLAYVIIKGGESPNIIPDFAEVEYDIRGRDLAEVEEIQSFVIDIASGAAKMTQTRVEWNSLGGVDSILCNKALSRHVHAIMEETFTTLYNEKDLDFGKRLNISANFYDERVFHTEVTKWGVDTGPILGSNDVGAPSHKAPLATFFAATTPLGIKSHSWQATASHGAEIGLKGMLYASKVLALSIYDILSTPKVLNDAKAEFNLALNKKETLKSEDKTHLT
jgi:aminobenzoyl-glutamate utilization protein B